MAWWDIFKNEESPTEVIDNGQTKASSKPRNDVAS